MYNKSFIKKVIVFNRNKNYPTKKLGDGLFKIYMEGGMMVRDGTFTQ